MPRVGVTADALAGVADAMAGAQLWLALLAPLGWLLQGNPPLLQI